MVESVFRQFKQFHFRFNPNDDYQKMEEIIHKGIPDYRSKPLDIHNGLTSSEKLLLHTQNKKPDFIEYSNEEITLVKANRIATNKANSCVKCS